MKAPRALTWLLLRWRLLLQVAPFVAAAVGIRAALFANGIEGSIEQSVPTTFLAASIFVTALMIQGVVVDFKEAERIPSEIEASFQSLLASCQVGIAIKNVEPNLANAAIHHVEDMLGIVLDFIDGTTSFTKASEDLRKAELALCIALDSGKAPINGVAPNCHTIRAKVSRIGVIRATSYILPGYTLMDVITSCVVVLLLLAKFPGGQTTALVTLGVFSGLYAYLGLLIRDLDDPFGYPTSYNRQCYQAGMVMPMTVLQEQVYGSSIDFSTLAVDFGTQMKTVVAQLPPCSPAFSSKANVGTPGAADAAKGGQLTPAGFTPRVQSPFNITIVHRMSDANQGGAQQHGSMVIEHASGADQPGHGLAGGSSSSSATGDQSSRDPQQQHQSEHSVVTVHTSDPTGLRIQEPQRSFVGSSRRGVDAGVMKPSPSPVMVLPGQMASQVQLHTTHSTSRRKSQITFNMDTAIALAEFSAALSSAINNSSHSAMADATGINDRGRDEDAREDHDDDENRYGRGSFPDSSGPFFNTGMGI